MYIYPGHLVAIFSRAAALKIKTQESRRHIKRAEEDAAFALRRQQIFRESERSLLLLRRRERRAFRNGFIRRKEEEDIAKTQMNSQRFAIYRLLSYGIRKFEHVYVHT